MMDRLTGDFKGASMFATVEQARQYNRLRQYEDTGLTPEEIAALKADRDQWQDGTIIVKLADAEAEIDRLCAALKLAQARAADYEAEVERLRAAYEAPPKPLTLEELDAMDNEPAFIQARDGLEFWIIADKDWQYEVDYDPDFINMTCSFDKDGHFGLHVLDWQAFRRRPEAARAALEGGQQ